MRRRVTFSRNLTLSLSRTCRCYCKYCAFATHRAHLHAPDEVLAGERADRHDGQVAPSPAADLEPHAFRLVVAACPREVDAGVHGCGRAVEHDRRVLVRAIIAGDGATAGEERREGREEQESHHRYRGDGCAGASPSRGT